MHRVEKLHYYFNYKGTVVSTFTPKINIKKFSLFSTQQIWFSQEAAVTYLSIINRLVAMYLLRGRHRSIYIILHEFQNGKEFVQPFNARIKSLPATLPDEISLIYAWKTNKYTNSFRLLIMYGSSYMFRHYVAILREHS
jgi:hypothetical protein